MSNPVRTHSVIRSRWSEGERAAHYRRGRFRSPRAARRDPDRIAALIKEHGVHGPILDVPCGTGRLRSALAAQTDEYVGVDASFSMLSESEDTTKLVTADALQLPFADGSFDVVVACRLFHHLGQSEDRVALSRELARVSSRLVIASFWDSASLHSLRRRIGMKHDNSTRRSLAKRTLRAELERSGLRILGWKHSFRFISQQAFFVAEKA